jgi:MFS transporter, DHA1 family, multidrug resistance protein
MTDPTWTVAESASAPPSAPEARPPLVPLLLAVFTVMLGLGIIAPLLPVYARDLGADGMVLGVVFSVFSLFRTLFTPVAGILSDRWGRKYFMLAGLASYCVVSLAYIRADSIPLLLLVRILHGVAAALVIPVANAYVGDLAPRNREGTYTGLFLVSFLLGFALGPALGGLLHDRFGIASCFLTLGLLASLSFTLVLFRVPNLKVAPLLRQEPSGEEPRGVLRSPFLLALLVFTLVSALGRGSILCFLPILATEKLGMSAGLLGTVLTTNLVLAAVLQLPLGMMADRFNRKILLLSGTMLSGAMFAAIPLATGFKSLFLINIAMGVAMALALPSSQAMAVSAARGRGMGKVLSILQSATGAGFAAGPLLSGIIYQIGGIDPVFYVCAGFLVAATVFGARFLKVHH